MNQVDLEEAINAQEDIREERNIELLEIQKTYGDNLPYQRDRIVNEARFYIEQGARAMLELGRRLIVIREYESPSELKRIIESDLNLSVRSAQRMMQTSIKFLNLGDSRAPTLAQLGSSKLFELITQDDDDLIALVDGGTIAGLTLDEVDKLSVRELKAALKTEREEKEASRNVSRNKDEKIEELATEIEKLKGSLEKKKGKEIKLDAASAELEQLDVYRTALNGITPLIEANIYKLFLLISTPEESLPAPFLREVATKVGNIQDQILELLNELPVDTGAIDTAWLPKEE